MKVVALLFFTLSLIIGYLIGWWQEKQNIDSDPSILSARFAVCTDSTKDDKSKGDCLRELATNALKNNSIAQVELAMRTITDPQKLQWCHEFLHYTGWELYKKIGDFPQALSEASGLCDSGMYHGVVEEHISRSKSGYDYDRFIRETSQACEDAAAKFNFPPGKKGNCYHGLGHAFMFITDNDLPGALSYCDQTTGENFGGCYTGAFMENIQTKQVGRNSGHTTEFSFTSKDPLYPCNLLSERQKHTCYRYRGVFNMLETQPDISRAFEECLKVETNYHEACFLGIGNNIPGPHKTTKAAAQDCLAARNVSSLAYERCIEGGMSFLIQLNLGNPLAAVEYCEVVIEEYQNLCYEEAGKNLREWVTDDASLKEKCQQFPHTEAQRICLQQAISSH